MRSLAKVNRLAVEFYFQKFWLVNSQVRVDLAVYAIDLGRSNFFQLAVWFSMRPYLELDVNSCLQSYLPGPQ